jgi:hypothetical protein
MRGGRKGGLLVCEHNALLTKYDFVPPIDEGNVADENSKA